MNIDDMDVGRRPRVPALMVLATDRAVPESVVEALRATDGVVSVDSDQLTEVDAHRRSASPLSSGDMDDPTAHEAATSAARLESVDRPLQLKDVAYRRLRSAIIDLSLPPGTQLREAALSTQLGISKTPLREAFIRLESEGFVEVRPYRGAVVSGYDHDLLVEIFELRTLLEGFTAARAAEVDDEEWRHRFRQNVERSRSALVDGNRALTGELLEEFDQLLQEPTRNPRVLELLAQNQGHVERIGRLTAAVPGRLEDSVAEHERIAEAVLSGDGRRAELLIRDHVASVMRTQLSAG